MVYTGTFANGLMVGNGKMQLWYGFVYEGEFSKNQITGKGICKSKSGNVYFSSNLPTLEHIGRIFFLEGKTLPVNSEKFDCLCISDEFTVYEGWMEIGENETQAILNSDNQKIDITSNLKGEGSFYKNNGEYTKGFWKSNFQFEGYVVSYEYYDVRSSNMKKFGGTFKGQLSGGSKSGCWIFENDDHEIYKGMMSGFQRQGYGTMKYLDGGFYKGMWILDSKNGFGTMVFTNGDIFKGKWSSDKMDGHGTMVYADGSIFKGIFNRDLPESGEFKFKNGEIFYGYLYYTYRGVYNYLNGDCYKGEMSKFKRHGNGIMHYTDGSIYKGNWHEDQKHGLGVFTTKTGWYYQGQWNNGKMEGIGLTSEDPSKLFHFQNNQPFSEFIPMEI